MPIELDLGALDDDEEEWDLENEEVEVWDGTMRVREGSVIGGDLNTLNVSLHHHRLWSIMTEGFGNVSTHAGRFRPTYSFTWIFPADSIRKFGIGITNSQPCLWKINMARKAEYKRNNHERR
jgi:hypothetical protein